MSLPRGVARFAAIAIIALLGGCGGGGGGTSTSEPAANPLGHSAAGPASDFETKGGDNSIQRFGREGSATDRQEAAAALHGYLDARAAGKWDKACGYMAPDLVRSLGQLDPAAGGGSPDCWKVLADLSAGVPRATLRQSAEADVGALRIEGENAFLLYRGSHDTDYFMPMTRQGKTWRVTAIAPSPLS